MKLAGSSRTRLGRGLHFVTKKEVATGESLLATTASRSTSISAPLCRRFALRSDSKFSFSSRSAFGRVKSFLRKEDAKEIEERWLKHITPTNKDPWEWNKSMLPKFTGIKGDAHVDFGRLTTPEQLLTSFFENMSYPGEWCNDCRYNLLENMSRPTYHWADESVFGFPPVAVVRMNWAHTSMETKSLMYAEVDWWKKLVRAHRVSKLIRRTYDPSMGIPPTEHDYNVTRDCIELPLPSRWLLELKKRKWPAPPRPEELDIDYTGTKRQQETSQIPFRSTAFPHPQHKLFDRPYWIKAEEEDEEDQQTAQLLAEGRSLH